jgi:hypothetical protein
VRPALGSPIFLTARAVSTQRTAVAAQTAIDIRNVSGAPIDIENRTLPPTVAAAAIGE